MAFLGHLVPAESVPTSPPWKWPTEKQPCSLVIPSGKSILHPLRPGNYLSFKKQKLLQSLSWAFSGKGESTALLLSPKNLGWSHSSSLSSPRNPLSSPQDFQTRDSPGSKAILFWTCSSNSFCLGISFVKISKTSRFLYSDCLLLPDKDTPLNCRLIWVLIWGLPCSSHAKSFQSCLTLYESMNCSLPGSSVHGILQARVLEWFAMPSSRGSSWPRDWTWVSCVSCIGWGVLYH